MKTLIVKIGPNSHNLQQIEINNEKDPFELITPDFRGKLVVRLLTESPLEYFKRKSRKFSIQFSGKFMEEVYADDLVFGAIFDNPINPPYGSGLAMTFANYIDPSLEADLYCAKPWLLSPLICAMNRLRIVSEEAKENISQPDLELRQKDKTPIDFCADKNSTPTQDHDFSWPWINGNELLEDTTVLTKLKLSVSERRIYFNDKSKLKATIITPEMLVQGDFFGPAVDFSSFCVSLGPFSFDISTYVAGQPITFASKSISTGKTFFVVQFEHVENHQ